MEIGEKGKKKLKVLDYLTLVVFVVGIILGYLEGGFFGSLMAVLLWLLGSLGSKLGLIPIAGPFIYYEVIGLLFSYLSTPFSLNLATLVIFLYFLGIALFYTLVSTLALIIFIKYWRLFKEEMKKITREERDKK